MTANWLTFVVAAFALEFAASAHAAGDAANDIANLAAYFSSSK